jgi:sugar phosphate isomerase/epimerase
VTAVAGADRVGLFSSCLPGWAAARVIQVASTLGFPAVEWGSGPGQAIEHPGAGSEMRQRCDRAGLLTSGLSVQHPEVTLATPRRVAPYVRLAVSLGAPHLRLFAPPYRGGSLHREQQRARAGLARVVDLAAPAGLAVLIETSPATLAPSPELAAALVEQHSPDHAGVLYDPGNTVIEGYAAPALAVARLGRHLKHVHVKNIAWVQRAGVWRWRCCALAGGLLDWREILGSLAAARYSGGFSIDHLGGQPTQQLLRKEADLLRELVSQATMVSGHPSKRKGATTSPASV